MKQRWFLLLGIAFTLAFTNTSTQYPTDYFRLPVDHTITLSGTFGELRPNHFHAGLDIKPKVSRKQGQALFAIANGSVARVRVSSYGYGNALYISHPNGYTSLYAHLERFPDKVAKYVKDKQYELKKFEVDLYPSAEELGFEKGDIIGYLGTSGRSFGPHVHFEIRHTESEVPINPLLFGIKVNDDIPPFLEQVKIYNLNGNRETISTNIFNTKKKTSKLYRLSKDTIEVRSDKIGIALKAYDKLNGAPNWNGVFALDLYQDDSLMFNFTAEAISFDQSRYINAHLDYSDWKRKRSYFNRCYLLPGNYLEAYPTVVDNGVLTVKSDKSSNIKMVTRDYAGNETVLNFILKKVKDTTEIESKLYNYILPYNEASIIDKGDLKLYFKDSTLYENLYAYITTTPDSSSGMFSDVHHIHNNNTPLHRYYDLKIRPNITLPDSLKKAAYVAQCSGNSISYYGGEWDGEYLKTKLRSFGNFCILLDTVPPQIIPKQFSQNMTKSSRMSFKIKDNMSGVKSYNAWVDKEWVLMEFDSKFSTIFHQFDGKIKAGKHSLLVSVTDDRGNETLFKSTFVK